MKKLTIFLGVILLSALSSSMAYARLKVASLHPLMTDVAKQVAGQHAQIIQLMDTHADPHHFQPSPRTLAKAKGARLYLASGKNLETYLGRLRDTLGSRATVLEVGKKIPSLKISARDSHYVCCPHHAHGAIDPHWWHKASNMQKAARIIAKEFTRLDPDNAASYKANAAAYSRRLASLDTWIKREVSRIPRKHRVLSTAHAAFGYFCKEYGFKALPVKGLTARHKTNASYQAEAIREIRKNGVKAIFPERLANPKELRVIAKETGVKIGGTLIADGAHNYEQMMRGNVQKIVKSLAR